MFLQQRDHPFARISVHSQESMVVADAIDALPDIFATYGLIAVFGREGLNGLLFALDVALYVAT